MNVAIPATDYSRSLATPSTALDQIAYISLCAFLFAIPWEEATQLTGFAIAKWLGFATLGIASVRMGVVRQGRKLSGIHYLLGALVTLSALSLAWTVDWESTVSRVGTYLQLLVLVWLIWELSATESRVLGLMQAYACGIFFTALLTIYNFVTGTTAAQLEAARGVETWDESRYSILGINENDLGLMLAMCIPLIIYLAVRAKGSLMKLFFWAQLVACSLAILLTGSRGSLISAAVAFVMLPLVIRHLSGSQRVISALACTALVICGIFYVPSQIWYRLSELSTELMDGTLTHRTLIWTAGLEALRDHPILGVGSAAYPAAVLPIVNVPYVAHNTFLSVLVELGVVGALLLFALLAAMYYTALQMRYLERCLWGMMLLTWTVGVMTLAWEYRKPTWIMFGFLLAHAYSRRVTIAHFRCIPRRFVR